MSFPNLDRLKAQLLQSDIQQKNQPLYQVINQLIDALRQTIQTTIQNTGSGGGGTPLSNLHYLTHENDQASLPNARQLIAGSGISFNKTANGLILNAQGLPYRESIDGSDGLPGPPGIRGEDGLPGIMSPWGLDDVDCCEPPVLVGFPSQIGHKLNYNVIWTSTGTAPSIGNGSLLGQFIRIGKLVFYQIAIGFGSTTSGGTGAWQFTLPSTAVLNPASVSPAIMLDAGTNWRIGIARLISATQINIFNDMNAASGITSTVPFTWATGDSFVITGYYFEA